MRVKNLLTLMVTLSFVSSFAATVPLWWDRITKEFDEVDDGVFLQTCSTGPSDGQECTSEKLKVDFFGTQDCDGVGAHPQTQCSCDIGIAQTWQCVDVSCPPFPPPSSGCPVGGGDTVIMNDPTCPDDFPSFDDTCPDDSSVSCSYGPNKWCVFDLALATLASSSLCRSH